MPETPDIEIPDFKNPAKVDARLQSIVNALGNASQIALVVEPSSHCDLQCSFCAAHSRKVRQNVFHLDTDLKKQMGHMTPATFADIVHKLEGLPKLKMLFFHGNGEPLLNPRLNDMVGEAKAANVAEKMTVVTNGTLLTAGRLQSLIGAGVNIFRVSLDYITPEKYKEHKGVDCVEKVLKNIEACIEYIKENAPDITLSIDCKEWIDNGGNLEPQLISAHFGPLIVGYPNISVRCTKEHNWIDQANGNGSNPFKRSMPCEQPFYMMMIHSDGDISMCCVDSKKELLLDNITTVDHLATVLKSARLKTWRKMHLEGDFTSLPACQHCNLCSSIENLLFEQRHMLSALL